MSHIWPPTDCKSNQSIKSAELPLLLLRQLLLKKLQLTKLLLKKLLLMLPKSLLPFHKVTVIMTNGMILLIYILYICFLVTGELSTLRQAVEQQQGLDLRVYHIFPNHRYSRFCQSDEVWS